MAHSGGGRGTNETPGTDYGSSGPMRGLEQNCTRWDKQTYRHTSGHEDSMTESAQWGGISKNLKRLTRRRRKNINN